MGTVLWANRLENGCVVSDESDKPALYRHLDKLDGLCQSAGLPRLSEICDSTDLRFNLSDEELPDGMSSTDEWMARDGIWIDGTEAVSRLERLRAEILARKTRFGLLKNDHDTILAEIDESLAWAGEAAARGGRFNFSAVM